MEYNHSSPKPIYPGEIRKSEDSHISAMIEEERNSFLNEHQGFYMTVNCEIMNEAGIHRGDTILVNKMIKPLNGNVVVVMVSGDVVIRFYQKVQAKIFLSGDAGKVCPMQIEPGFEDFEVLGVVTYVVKKI